MAAPKMGRSMTLPDALDDVQARFILNLPAEERETAHRLFFQIEQAHWFYEDFLADHFHGLPHLTEKDFGLRLFIHCPLLQPMVPQFEAMRNQFKTWKGQIPTAGCLLLSPDYSQVVLVRNWKGNSRSLPKGKINQNEEPMVCAAREVLEETGFDVTDRIVKEDCFSQVNNGQRITMFVIQGVPLDFPFEPQTRKEISAVNFFPIDNLPKGVYGVEPFIKQLKKWLKKKGKLRSKSSGRDVSAGRRGQHEQVEEQRQQLVPQQAVLGERPLGKLWQGEEQMGQHEVLEAGSGFDFEAMMKANEAITGQTFEYKGEAAKFGVFRKVNPPGEELLKQQREQRQREYQRQLGEEEGGNEGGAVPSPIPHHRLEGGKADAQQKKQKQKQQKQKQQGQQEQARMLLRELQRTPVVAPTPLFPVANAPLFDSTEAPPPFTSQATLGSGAEDSSAACPIFGKWCADVEQIDAVLQRVLSMPA